MKTVVKNNLAEKENQINRPVFDMIRSTAVLLVFTIHFLAYRNIPVPQFVFNFFTHCSYGVSLFFAMSGYLIMQSVNNSKTTKEYFLKRVSRIIPAYYAVLVFGIIVWDLILGKMPADTLLGLGWIRYFLFLNVLVPSGDYYFWNDLWGLWTMSCFMLFYLLAPLIKRWIKNYGQAFLLMVGTVIAAYGAKAVIYAALVHAEIPSADVFAGDSAVFNMISFSFGVTAWYAVKDNKDRQYLSLVIVMLAGFLAINTDSYNRIIWSLFTVAFMLSMKHFEYGEKTEWIGRVLAVFGKYSFTVYLVHMPVLDLLQYFSDQYFYLGFVPFTILTIIIVIIAAVLVHNLIEKPFSQLIMSRLKRQNGDLHV